MKLRIPASAPFAMPSLWPYLMRYAIRIERGRWLRLCSGVVFTANSSACPSSPVLLGPRQSIYLTMDRHTKIGFLTAGREGGLVVGAVRFLRSTEEGKLAADPAADPIVSLAVPHPRPRPLLHQPSTVMLLLPATFRTLAQSRCASPDLRFT
jgi:hypothetical protein